MSLSPSFSSSTFVQIYQLIQGPDAIRRLHTKTQFAGMDSFHLVALLFALYHSVTWFQSSAVVLPVRLGERLVSRSDRYGAAHRRLGQ